MLLDSYLADDTPALLIDFDHAKKITNNEDQKNEKRQTVVCS
jgi:hypothetical protein